MTARRKATIEDLYRVPDKGKAELVNGEIVRMAPTGGVPARAGAEIYIRLREYERSTGNGYALPDNVGFIVNLPNRRSFSPDVAFHTGQLCGGQFLEGAPVFVVEVRSENDYGPPAERAMREKRADYFAAGTLVVWDVDVLRDMKVTVYRSHNPEHPTEYRGGGIAEAEPALPGWSLPVNDILA